MVTFTLLLSCMVMEAVSAPLSSITYWSDSWKFTSRAASTRTNKISSCACIHGSKVKDKGSK